MIRTGAAGLAALVAALLGAPLACTPQDVGAARQSERTIDSASDTLGVAPESPATIRVQARRELVENSAVTRSATQPGVFFTINDSGNDPLLFALDSSGADRGVWRVTGARNVDWESASTGTCPARGPTGDGEDESVRWCVYIGDTGDNEAKRPTRTIYRVVEPVAQRAGFTGDVAAEALVYRYADGPHDVEAMYVVPDGDAYLITKRPLRDAAGRRRPSLVFRLPATAWERGGPAVAELVDSLPIVPGSAPMRQITDAALSPDARHLAVRTYAQLYIFATDSITGRVRGSIRPSVCLLTGVERRPGEGVAWLGPSGRLLLTSEGRRSPMYSLGCPMPAGPP